MNIRQRGGLIRAAVFGVVHVGGLDGFDEGNCRGFVNGGDGQGIVLSAEFEGLLGGDEVAFVKDAQHRLVTQIELFEDSFDGGNL